MSYDGPADVLSATTIEAIRKHRVALTTLIRSAWWPENRPRPNLLDLCNRHGSVAVKTALARLGCDFDERNPTWEELFVVAEALTQSNAEVQP